MAMEVVTPAPAQIPSERNIVLAPATTTTTATVENPQEEQDQVSNTKKPFLVFQQHHRFLKINHPSLVYQLKSFYPIGNRRNGPPAFLDCSLLIFDASHGSQRERDRERAAGDKGKNSNNGLKPEQRRERDGKALQEKAVNKAAEAAAAGSSGGAGGKGAAKIRSPCLLHIVT
ncbi:unnamed protein product [Arabidopsis lyrata]|nr:unnamed protein product [Arabidopsis lyrata]